ncbi:MAG: helix-turn-helix domain-containing protein [Faecousia sp.]
MAADAGLSQRKLAERFCIPVRTVEDWCAGKRIPPDYVRMMIQESLGLLRR